MNTLDKWNELRFKPFAAFTDEDTEAFLVLQDFYEPNPFLRVARSTIDRMRSVQ